MVDVRRCSAVWIALVVVLLAGIPSSAQESTKGEAHGVVADTSGAVLPGVALTATHVQTGVVRTTTTSASGTYRMPAPALGDYVITVELSGFKTVTRAGVSLGLGQQLDVNITMELGRLIGAGDTP